MSIVRMGRAAWLLSVVMLAAPMLVPLAGREKSKLPEPSQQPEPREITNIINHIIASEWQAHGKLVDFSPRIETYLQYYRPDPELGDVVTNDDYFLARLKFSDKVDNRAMEASFVPDSTREWLHRRPEMLRPRIQVDQFASEALSVDENNFDRKHYSFEAVRWEYLGDIRCLAIDIHPLDSKTPGAFEGRIWVEDHDYAIVRLNGTRLNPPRWDFYVHFDCWRENLQPGLWLPVYIFSQESDRGKRLRYTAETRMWGYDLTAHPQQQEWTNILVEAAAPVRDSTEVASDLSPVEEHRQVTIEAEQNVLDRLEKARLIAPPGPWIRSWRRWSTTL